MWGSLLAPARFTPQPRLASAAHARLRSPTFRLSNCGGGGIRTPVPFRESGFQDRRLQPLGHSSRKAGENASAQTRICKALARQKIGIVLTWGPLFGSY